MSGSRQILTPRKRILRTLPSEIAVVAQQEGPLRRKVEIRHCNNGGRVRVRKQLGRVAQLFRRDKRCRRVNTGENIELAITRTILEKNFRQDIGTRCMVIAIIFAAKERHARAIFLSDLRDLLIVGRYHHFVEKPALERRLDRICDDGPQNSLMFLRGMRFEPPRAVITAMLLIAKHLLDIRSNRIRAILFDHEIRALSENE